MPSKEDIEKTLSAVIATIDGDVKITLMVKYMGTTYDTLQKRLLPYKEEARRMREEAPATPAKPSPTKRKRSGKGCKDNSDSPTKKRKDDPDTSPSTYCWRSSQMNAEVEEMLG